MQMRKRIRPGLAVCAVSILAFLFLLPASPAAHAADGKDYVIVIDVSTSMQDIFDEVKRLTKQTLSKAKPGDNVAIITFGERARLLDRRQIRGKADIDDLNAEIDKLYPTDYATYINSGLEKSMSELRYLFDKYPNRERVLLWLSDDKDNPPGELGQDYVSLDKLRQENQNFEPHREWFAYQAPLSEVKNDTIQDFVTWARRTTFRVGVKQSDVNLGSFENENVEKKIVLNFEPQHPGAAGLEFMMGASLVDPENPDRVIPVNLTPNRIVASDKPWQQEFDVSFTGSDPGEYQGQLEFKSLSGPVLDVVPSKVTLTAMIVPPKPPEVPVAPPEAQKLEEVVATAKETATGRPAGMERPEKPLTFGPLEPGKKDSKMITLYLNKEADADSISQDLNIQVPAGFTIESKIFGKKGTKLAAEITVAVDRQADVPEEMLMQGAYEGSMHFVSNESGVEVLPLVIPVRIEMNTDRVRWGKKMLATTSVGRTRARQMTFEELTKELEGEGEKPENRFVAAVKSIYAKARSRYVVFPILGALLILFIVLLYRLRPSSEAFVGELVLIKDPSDSKTKNINLKRIGSLHGKDVLTIGSSPNADIRLNHQSAAPIHCRLSAKKNEDKVDVAILPAKGNLLKVNDVEATGRVRLSDKDLIGIGEFILLFSHPESQKEVVVHFVNGQTMRGTPVTWDVGASYFELLRGGGEGVGETAEEISLVRFENLKAVFFLQDSRGSMPGISRDRIRHKELFEVTFFDGETIQGNPLIDYSDLSARFYLVPKEMPNIVSILIERASVKEMKRREDKGESEASAGMFGFLKGRKGAAPAE